MTSPASTPSTIPPCSEPVNVDLEAINAQWERTQAQKPHEVVRKHIEFHQAQGHTDIVMALNLVWSDMNFLFNGGYEKLKEKK